MEAPEKIFLHVRANTELGSTWHTSKINNRDIEYVRKDAFIEKACEFWAKNQRGFVTHKDIVDFKNYLKGE